jgi:hypothetical protein
MPRRLLRAELRPRPPRAAGVAHAQLDRVTLTSRAFYHDQLGPSAPSWPTWRAWTSSCR